MADASDSKSDEGDLVWVQVPSPAFFYKELHKEKMQKSLGNSTLPRFSLCLFINLFALLFSLFVT